MSNALEVSITLDDVFAVVQNKRAPLAPELAGYLALEIAEGADGKGGDVDPRSVYIADEGTVALVRPKRDAAVGNAEASIRSILGRLLEASGSQTPALAAASRRKATGNLGALVEELEAALIPVNRAAGRRALARLAREVKRVTLGVGRNASAPASARGPSPSQPSASEAPPRTTAASTHPTEEAPTARRTVDPDVLKGATSPPPPEAPTARRAKPTEKPTRDFRSAELARARAREERGRRGQSSRAVRGLESARRAGGRAGLEGDGRPRSDSSAAGAALGARKPDRRGRGVAPCDERGHFVGCQTALRAANRSSPGAGASARSDRAAQPSGDGRRPPTHRRSVLRCPDTLLGLSPDVQSEPSIKVRPRHPR